MGRDECGEGEVGVGCRTEGLDAVLSPIAACVWGRVGVCVQGASVGEVWRVWAARQRKGALGSPPIVPSLPSR